MKTVLGWLCVATVLQSGFLLRAGTWQDHFTQPSLRSEWTGETGEFSVADGVLTGVSARPIAPSPLNIVSVNVDSSNCVVGAWVNVISPNTHVCTKGALVLRQTGTNGYVYALHEATQTVEVYRLSDHEMLLSKPAKIELQHWYHLRAELNGPAMHFFVDESPVGSVVDARCTNGAVGVAVQDANAVSFDDFFVSGSNVSGNVDYIDAPVLTLSMETPGAVTVRFEAPPGFNYYVRAAAAPLTHDWQTLTNFLVKLVPGEAVITDSTTNRTRFYRVEKVDCNCD